MSDLAGNRLKTIKSWDEVPEFQNEHEEHEFWGSHSLSEELLETFEPRSDAARHALARLQTRRGAICRRHGSGP